MQSQSAALLVLEEWIRDYLLHDNVRAHEFPEMGTGIQALQDIKKEGSDDDGNILLSVMPQRYYTAKNIMYLAGVSVPDYLKCSPLDCLTAFLLIEDHLGDSSVRPYLNTLPRSFSNPLYLSQEIPSGLTSELEDLLNVQLADLKRTRKVLRRFFDEPEMAHMDLAFTKSSFLWAYFAVATRSLYIDMDLPALVPFMDFFNHSPYAHVSRDFTELQLINCFLVPKTKTRLVNGTFVLVTDDEYASGDQVFINYGSHSNCKLAVYYGFVADENPFSTVDFDSTLVLQELFIPDGLLLFLDKYGIMKDLYCSWDGFSNNLRCICRASEYCGSEPWSILEQENLPKSTTVTGILTTLIDYARARLRRSLTSCFIGVLVSAMEEQVDILEHCMGKLLAYREEDG